MIIVLRVGLTGGIGSGKSTVSQMLKEKGLAVIDADLIAREVLELYPSVKERIKNTFGAQFFDEEGNMKRRELGNYIFHYPKERIKLEEIMLPYIKEEIFHRISEYGSNGERICIIDAPTLIEQGMHKEMDVNILVWVDRNTQFDRLKKRDALKDTQIIDRLNAQMSLNDKKAFVDFIIDNNSSISSTREQVENIISILRMYNN
jgi:dephospho-CoA kinase